MIDLMSQRSSSHTLTPSTDDDLRNRRASLQRAATDLHALEIEIHGARSNIADAQAYLQFIAPPSFKQHMSTAPDESETVRIDVKIYLALDATQTALMNLAADNRRFSMVIDIMAAALHMVEPVTDIMAHAILAAHTKACREAIAEVEETLTFFPRLKSGLLRRHRMACA